MINYLSCVDEQRKVSKYGLERSPFLVGQHFWLPSEHQVYESALSNCGSFAVLDIDGGQGLKARYAIAHGAAAVDGPTDVDRG